MDKQSLVEGVEITRVSGTQCDGCKGCSLNAGDAVDYRLAVLRRDGRELRLRLCVSEPTDERIEAELQFLLASPTHCDLISQDGGPARPSLAYTTAYRAIKARELLGRNNPSALEPCPPIGSLERRGKLLKRALRESGDLCD